MINTTNINKNGELDKKAKIGTCKFPFKYYKKDRYECVDGKNGKWCATELKEDNTYKHYGYCILDDKTSSPKQKKSSKQEKTVITKKKTRKSIDSNLLKLTSEKGKDFNSILFHIKKEINTIDEEIYYQIHLYYKVDNELTYYNTSNVTEYQYNNIIGNFYEFIWGYNYNGVIQFEPYKYTSIINNVTDKEMIDFVIKENPLDYNIILTQFKKHQNIIDLKKINIDNCILNVKLNDKVRLDDGKIDTIQEIIYKKQEPYIKVSSLDKLYSFDEFQPLIETPDRNILNDKLLLEGDYVGVLNRNKNKLIYLGRIKKEISNIFKDNSQIETIFIENAFNDDFEFRKLVSILNTDIIFLNQEQIKIYQELVHRYVITQVDRYKRYKDIFKINDNVILKSQPNIGSFLIDGFVIWSDLNREEHIGEDVFLSYNNLENPYKLLVSYEDIEKIEEEVNSSSDKISNNSDLYHPVSPISNKSNSSTPFRLNSSSLSSPKSSNNKVIELIKTDIYQKLGLHKNSPLLYGWDYIGDDYENIGGERYVSLILDDKGNPTDIWDLELNDYKDPLHYVEGWKQEELYYKSGDIIPNLEVIKYLKNNQVPNNWDKMIKTLSKSKVVKLPSIPSPPNYKELLKSSTPKKRSSSSSSEYQDIINPDLSIIPYNINTKYEEESLKLGDKVMIKHGIKHPLNGLIGNIIKIDKDNITIDPEKGILDTDEPVELFIEDVIKIEMISISNYWNQLLSTSPLVNQNVRIKNCENRFFNTIYSYINNEFIDDEEIIINSNDRNPIYDIDKINPILKADRLAFIRRGRIINKNNKGYLKKYRLWYIYSKNEYSDKMNIFYFNYSRDLKSNIPPKYDWYGNKDRNGKNIHLNFNNIDENLHLFSPSRLVIFTTKQLPIKSQYKKEIKCLNCDSSIHTTENCPNKPRNEIPVCSICRKKGHWEEFCPSKNKIKEKSSKLIQQKKEVKETKKRVDSSSNPNKLSVKKLALLKKNKK